jgi:uncharacterized membrane protein YebE (DUF533 family)
MSFGAILGQMMQQGLSSRGGGGGRLQDALKNLGARQPGQPGQGGGANDLFGQLQTMLAGAQSQGGIATQAKDFLTKGQVGGVTGGQMGGIGAIAGALLGGGKGAVRGGALAMLGALALTALRQSQARAGAAPAQIAPEEVEAAVSPDSEQLMVRAMIAAAKADGAVDQAEMQKIIGQVSEGGVEPSERDFVMSELAAPLDVDAIVAAVNGPAQAAQVYAASLMAITADTEVEKAYLRDLAARLNLDAAAVAQLHQMTGAPAI